MFVRRVGLDGFHFLHKSLPCDSMSEHSLFKETPPLKVNHVIYCLLVVH